jgi:exopolysaccharide production protein ExoY
LPTHPMSEASDAYLPTMGARAAVRPRVVGGETGPQRTLRSEVGFLHDAVHLRSANDARTASQELPLAARARDGRNLVRVSFGRTAVKRAFDILGVLMLGLVFLPLILAIALVLASDGGPVIYRHRRIGRDGRVFECLKFRSMVPDADRKLRDLLERYPDLKAEWVRDHKLRDDPRVTRLGRFLRRTSLDELPQIWNVLRGEMSLVGPRPVVREELMRYGRSLPLYLAATPGITGLWQVTGRNDTDYRRRVALDVYYVRRQNLFLDLYILLKTTHVVLGGGGAY